MVLEDMRDLLLSAGTGSEFRPLRTLPVVACLVFTDVSRSDFNGSHLLTCCLPAGCRSRHVVRAANLLQVTVRNTAKFVFDGFVPSNLTVGPRGGK